MWNRTTNGFATALCILLLFAACKTPSSTQREENKTLPPSYNNSPDTSNIAQVKWKEYFTDSNLVMLIDAALKNNQELNILLQEINLARSEVKDKKGEYLPFVDVRSGAGIEKVGRYTSQGANDANTEIKVGKEFPEPLPDVFLAAHVSWELDIWKKLRNAKKAAVFRYLASVEGKNFMQTNLIAEIANAYYELMALDNQLDILKRNIRIQKSALQMVKLQKSAAKVTELAVRKFQAEVLKNQGYQYTIQQRIIETENELNFLVGRFPQPIQRNSPAFIDLLPDSMHAGNPAQLLAHRPDIRQAEMELEAARLDVSVARARFYPALGIAGGIGYQAFNPSYLLETPESMLYSMAGELTAPLLNRNAIKAAYAGANARQVQAVYHYERTILNAYVEVLSQLSMINNLDQSYQLKAQEVQALTESIGISTGLFKSARADYMEVLLTQRDALESTIELIETKKQQLNATVKMYQLLGGGWN